jgi:mono/diheme cytochrome c family protein
MYIRLSSLLLTLTITLALSACGSSNKAAVSTTDPVMNPKEASATIAPTAALITVTPALTEAPNTPTPKASPAATVQPTITPVVKPTEAPKAPDTDSAVAEALFKQSCTSCHGVDLGGDFGPNLQKVGSQLSKAQIITQITNGGDAMPAFEKKLKADDIEALATWLAAKK